MEIVLRKATENDVLMIYHLANEQLTRSMFFNQKPISMDEHQQWFNKILKSNDTVLLIAETIDDHMPVGQIRFDPSGEISLSVSTKYRGKQLGVEVVKVGIEYLKKHHLLTKMKRLVAHIKMENISSIKTFERAGFVFSRETVVKQTPCLEYIFEL